MKAFQKLALVSAIALTSSAFAMEVADDETLAATTGQDGITILVAPGTRTDVQLAALNVSAATLTSMDVNANNTFKGLSIGKVVVHDKDGVINSAGPSPAPYIPAATNRNSGAMIIDGVVLLADDTSPIVVEIDTVGSVVDLDTGTMASTGNDGAMLNVAIRTPRLAVRVGDVKIANSTGNFAGFSEAGVGGANTVNEIVSGVDGLFGTADDGLLGTNGTEITIMSGMEVILGAMTTQIQLGREAQGSMIAVDANIEGGLTINNFALNDQGGAISGGSINAAKMTVINAGGVAGVSNLQAKAYVNVGTTTSVLGEGLYITVGQLGTAGGGADVTLYDQALGRSVANGGAAIGDVQLLGLNLAGTTLVIKGH